MDSTEESESGKQSHLSKNQDLALHTSLKVGSHSNETRLDVVSDGKEWMKIAMVRI